MAQDHLAGATSARPDRRTIRRPTGKPTLSRLRVLIAEPAPGFHPQTPAQFANDIAIRRIQHHIEQHSTRLILRR